MCHGSPSCCDVLWSWEAFAPPGQWWKRPACAYIHGNDLRASPLRRCLCHLLSGWCHLGNMNSDRRPALPSYTQQQHEHKHTGPEGFEAQLTSVHAEVTVVFVQGLQSGDIRGSFNNLIHPLDGTHHLVTFFLSEDWRAFMFGNLRYDRRSTSIVIIKENNRYR